jgi:hypothetical protein
MFSPRFLCGEYTPIPYTGRPTARLSKLAHSKKVSSRVPHPYVYLRTGGFHSAEGLNCFPPHNPHPHPDTPSPSPSAQDLTHPSGNGLPQNALESVESPTRAVVFFFALLSAR